MCTFVLSKASKLSTKSQRALRWRHQRVCIYLFENRKEADANVSRRVTGSVFYVGTGEAVGICAFVLRTQVNLGFTWRQSRAPTLK